MKTRAEELKSLINALGDMIVDHCDVETCKIIDEYVKYKIELSKIEG